MFNKTLIVVYKDEMFVNQLKKLVQQKGTTGIDTINIVSWSEKFWLSQKKAGNISEKVLYIGDIKGTEKLTPIVDIQLDKYGVKFGWAGPQAILFTEPKVLANQGEYNKFLDELNELPIPESFKKIAKENDSIPDEVIEIDENINSDNEADEESQTDEPTKEKKEKFAFLKKAKAALEEKTDDAEVALKKMSADAKEKKDELFRDRSLIKKQMLFYGIDKVYNDWLESFMNI